MDNLSAHMSIKVIELALKHQVILMRLSPNTTYTLQPLDVITFEFFLFYFRIIGLFYSFLCMEYSHHYLN